MKKKELIEALKKDVGLEEDRAKKAVELILEAIANTSGDEGKKKKGNGRIPPKPKRSKKAKRGRIPPKPKR